MPTSATGTSDPDARGGFTLVELLVVMAVIGVAATAVVLSIPDRRPSVLAEAEVFAARLALAREEAVLSNRTVAVRLSEDGYRFESYDGVSWTALSGVLQARAWPEGMIGPAAGRVTFDATGLAEPVHWQLARNGQVQVVAVDGAGEVSLAP